MQALTLGELPADDLTGKSFARWKVVAFAGRDRKSIRHWHCVCQCGTRRAVTHERLKYGKSLSCGCYALELRAARTLTHGEGRSRTVLYVLWVNIRARCLNPEHRDYPRYGGRGISIFAAWADDYAAFRDYIVSTLGPRPRGTSLDRRDNDKGYQPDNVRWANRNRQQRNRRDNLRLTFRGETLPMADWAERVGLPQSTLNARVRRGWTAERALTQPIQEKSR